MYVLKAEEVQDIVNLTMRGHTMRWVSRKLGVAITTVTGYRDAMMANGIFLCGCGMSILHLGRCLWRRTNERGKEVKEVKEEFKPNTQFYKTKRVTGPTQPTKLPGSEILSGISEISAYYIPVEGLPDGA